MKLRILNTEIELSYTLLCLAAVAVILNIAGDFLFCVIAVIIHESGHLLAMLRYRYFPDRIKIAPFEILISDPLRERRSDRENFFIIFFGPFSNFICVIPFYLLYLLGGTAFLRLSAANLSVGLFNSLPVLTLDGGQLLSLLLSRRIGRERAGGAVNMITLATIFPLAALGFIVLFQSKGNFSLLFVCFYLVLSLLKRDGGYD